MKKDPLAIPDFLLVKNRKALTPEQHAAIQQRRTQQQDEERRNWNLPRHLDAEGEALLARLNAPKAKRVRCSLCNDTGYVDEILPGGGEIAKVLCQHNRTTPTPRPSRDGLTSIAELAKEHDMLPRDARAILRATKHPKPAHGWAFNASECEAIRTLLKAGRVDRHKPTGDTIKRVSKRRTRSRIPPGAAARGEVVFTGKANVTRPAQAQATVHANIFEAKHASRIKEVPACHTPTDKRSGKSARKSPPSRVPSKRKTSASLSSKKRSAVRSTRSAKSSTRKSRR